MDVSFTLKDSEGKDVRFEDYKGKRLVIYFYPKDNTPGCTIEAVEFSELLEEFKKLNTEVIGISKDSIKSHQNFIAKKNLSVNLLSDPEKEVLSSFNVLKAKKMFGKEYMGVERSTFLFDETGELITEFRNVKAAGHAREVLDYMHKHVLN